MGDLLAHLNNKLGYNEGFSWSRNNISPGTSFMNKLMDHLNGTIFEEHIFDACESLKHMTISGIDIAGEGEIKILHYIEKLIKTKYKNDKYVVYSPDSDVIILLLMMNINVSMLRYDQQKSTEDEPMYSIVDINKFKDILYTYISDMTNKKLDKMRVIMDIVFILTVFGDDFLPKLETVRVNTDINLLIKHYVVIVIKYDYILNINNSNLNNLKYEINTDVFYQFLLLLQKKEDYFLRRNARYHISSNYNRIVSDIIGYNMNQLRDYIVEYLWKFIYFNKPADITISPINAHMHISIEKLEEYMNKPEQHLNISSFTHMDFKNTNINIRLLYRNIKLY
jgi:5'-3' exonuclease